jgi:hypothetical protein
MVPSCIKIFFLLKNAVCKLKEKMKADQKKEAEEASKRNGGGEATKGQRS